MDIYEDELEVVQRGRNYKRRTKVLERLSGKHTRGKSKNFLAFRRN